MLSFREQLSQGKFESKPTVTKIPKKSAMLGTITEDGYCDYEVPEQTEYLSRDLKRGNRLHQSTLARKQRKQMRKIRYGE